MSGSNWFTPDYDVRSSIGEAVLMQRGACWSSQPKRSDLAWIDIATFRSRDLAMKARDLLNAAGDA